MLNDVSRREVTLGATCASVALSAGPLAATFDPVESARPLFVYLGGDEPFLLTADELAAMTPRRSA